MWWWGSLLLLLFVAVLVTAVAIFALRTPRRPAAVVLIGPCGAGKTLLFYRLTEDEHCDTVSSMQSNQGQVGDVALVDFPGHYRLRGGLKDELDRATKLVMLVDAAAMAAQAKPAAELLFQVLTAFQNAKRPPPVLLICNKTDKATAKTPQRVKLMLMNEIETLRKTAHALRSIDDDDDKQQPAQLGVEGRVFSFDQHSPCPITFLPISVKNDDLSPVRAFVQTGLVSTTPSS
ncbi:hypothetical protein CTAYLR_008541 [Chrysophaeum taylorii]|uniref:Signal recognition particle receptor subunit beta n=1 Tax=Chrysophaeum taylorii TaxID=2483200 RepID=A0AAD7U6Q4_9STRA|nr:hypothetical protein CTAYLR_008541 [Chrysophaeum taylorii]